MLTNKLKQSNSALPDYITFVKCADKSGVKKTKVYIGLKELYKIQENDEKSIENLFRQHQIKKYRK